MGAPTLCAALRVGRRPGVVVHQNSVVAQVLSKPRVANSSPIILNFLACIDSFSLSSPSCVPCHPPRHPVQRPRRQRLREAGEAAALVTGGAQLLQMVEPVETDKTIIIYIFFILREIFFLLCEIVVQPPPHGGGQRLRRQKRRWRGGGGGRRGGEGPGGGGHLLPPVPPSSRGRRQRRRPSSSLLLPLPPLLRGFGGFDVGLVQTEVVLLVVVDLGEKELIQMWEDKCF